MSNALSFTSCSTVIDGTSDMAIDGTTNPYGSIPRNAKGAIITVRGTGIMWRMDATACSTGSGHYQASGSSIVFDSWSMPKNDWYSVLKAFRFCPSSSGTCTIGVTLFD